MPQDLQTELNAILTGCAIAPITRGFLRITGPDATRWLNGMVTNNIKDLQPGEGNYNFLLNAQGRIMGDCTIYREPDGSHPAYILETETAQIEPIHELLDKFIIMDDVELTPSNHFDSGLLLLGPKASSVLRSIDDPFLGDTLSTLGPLRIGYYRLTSEQVTTPASGITPQFFVTSDTMLPYLIEKAIDAGAVKVSPEALEAYRSLSGTPRYGTDIRNTDTTRDLPQETAQNHALHFNKGCYVGQEIVERIHSRGQVHRTFTRFELTGELPTLPAAITADGKPAGEITSAVQIGDKLHALGYIRREAATAALTYPGGTAKSSDRLPPWNLSS
jgi:folate-binding protein YgfZ